MLLQVIRAPDPIPDNIGALKSVFLAGSIDNSSPVGWRDELAELLKDEPLVLLDPQRPDWNDSWDETAQNPQFVEQIEWQLQAIEQCRLVVTYFMPGTSASITLLELGLAASTGRIIVCCLDGYTYKGDVELVCQRYGIPQVHNLEALAAGIRRM